MITTQTHVGCGATPPYNVASFVSCTKILIITIWHEYEQDLLSQVIWDLEKCRVSLLDIMHDAEYSTNVTSSTWHVPVTPKRSLVRSQRIEISSMRYSFLKLEMLCSFIFRAQVTEIYQLFLGLGFRSLPRAAESRLLAFEVHILRVGPMRKKITSRPSLEKGSWDLKEYLTMFN